MKDLQEYLIPYKWEIVDLTILGCICEPIIQEYTLYNALDSILSPENWTLQFVPQKEETAYRLSILINGEWIHKEAWSLLGVCQVWGLGRDIAYLKSTRLKTVKYTEGNYLPIHDIIKYKTPCPVEYLKTDENNKPTAFLKLSKIDDYIRNVLKIV